MGPLHVLYSVGGAVLIRVAAATEILVDEILVEEEVSADTL